MTNDNNQLPAEEFRPIPGYPGYAASNKGSIRSRKVDRLRPATRRDGYQYVEIGRSSARRQFAVHRLVAAAFLGLDLQDSSTCVDHINGVRADNRAENLRACTWQQNARNYVLASDNRSGHRGVQWRPDRGRWRAYIAIDRRTRQLGTYRTYAEAVAARRGAELATDPEFWRSSAADATCVSEGGE